MLNMEDILNYWNERVPSTVLSEKTLVIVQTDHNEFYNALSVRLGNDEAGEPAIIIDIRLPEPNFYKADNPIMDR